MTVFIIYTENIPLFFATEIDRYAVFYPVRPFFVKIDSFMVFKHCVKGENDFFRLALFAKRYKLIGRNCVFYTKIT